MRFGVLKLAAATALLVGMASLGAAQTTLDDFEDGDIQGWTGDTGSFSAQTGTALEGSYSIELDGSAGDSYYIKNDFIDSKHSRFDIKIKPTDTQDDTDWRFETDSGTRVIYFELNNGGFRVYESGFKSLAGSFSSNEVLDISFRNIDYSTNTYDFYLNGQLKNSSLSFSNDVSELGTVLVGGNDRNSDGTLVYFDSLSYGVPNSNPQFNSTSVSPDPPLIGENVSYSAEVYDPDGSVDHTNLTLEYGGSTVVSDAQRTGNNPFWNDIYQPSDGNKWLNATLETVDDAGATTTTEIDRYLSNDAPSISISNLNNETYFSYSRDASITVTDSDSNPNEDITCSLYIDGSQYDTRTVVEGSSFTTTTEAGLGGHTFKASCSDPAGNTNNQTVSYTVDEFVFNSVSGSSSTFEKVNESYAVDSKVGDMVENVEYTLNYDSSFVDTKNVDYSNDSVLNSDVNNLLHVTPFVSSDGTSKSYEVRANVTYSDFNANTESSMVLTSSSNTQTIDQAYKFGTHNLEDGFNQLEGSTLDYTATADNKTSNTLATVETVTTSYNQTGETKDLDKQQGFSYSNLFNTDLINSSSESFNLDTTVKIVYNNDDRSFSSSKQVTLDKISIESSSTASNEETLVFDSLNEVNESSVDSELNVGLYVWNPDQPDKTRSFNFESSGTSTHSFYIDPGYASVQAQSFKADDNQTDWDTNYQNTSKNYPKRRYYFLNETLNNQTTKINLYMLKSSEAENIEFEVLDSDLRPLKGHVVRIERVFSGVGESRVVSMLRTGQQGKDTTYINPNEQYVFTVYNPEGELIQEIGPQSISGLSTTLEVDEEELLDYSNLINDVRFTDIQENNQSLIVEYVSDTNKLNNISLSVYKEELFSRSRIDVDSSTNLQGQLRVSGFNASNESISYDLQGTFGDEKVLLNTGGYGEIDQDYGDAGIFMSLLMFLALSIAGLWRPSASIGLGVVGLSLMYFIGFISISQTALISIAVLGALMVWRMT